jgi:tripartite ATP-independent transporter DctP family solute receptor
MIRRHALCLSVGLAAFGVAAVLPSPAAADREVRFSLGPANDHPESEGARIFAGLVDKKSGGKIKVKLFYNAVLGSDTQAVGALRAGTLEMTGPSSSPLVGIVKDYAVFDFPFLFKNDEEADAILDGAFGKMMLDRLSEVDLVGLAFWENGFRNVTNSRRPIKAAEDLKNIKLRVMQNPVYIDAFSALGANPTAMSFSEVYTALETRAIDAQENPFNTIKTAKLYEVQKHLAITRHTYTPYVIVFSKKIWETMSPDEQKILRDAAMEARIPQRKINREFDAAVLKELEGPRGMLVTRLADAEVEKLQAAVKPVTEKYSKEMSPAVMALLTAELTKIRKK